jgi:hypothetical protein
LARQTAGNPYGSTLHRGLDTNVVLDLPSLPSDLDGYWDDTFRRWDPDHGFDLTHARGF